MVHHSKPSRVHSTAQRCQTIIAMTPFYQPRTVTMHQQLRLVLSKTGGLAMRQTVHIVRSPVKSCGGPCVCAGGVETHNHHTTHNTTLCGYRSTTQLRKTVQSTHMSVCTHYMNTRRIIGFAVDHLKYSRLLTRLHCRWQRGMPLGYIGSHCVGEVMPWRKHHQQHTWDVT